MLLILWRHAHALPLTSGMSDADRPLSPKGHRQAKHMASWLNKHLPSECNIFVSPTRRTLETARTLGRKFTTTDLISPSATPRKVIDFIQKENNHNNILLIGHQPTLGNIASIILSKKEIAWPISKGAIWWIELSPVKPAKLLHVKTPPSVS